MSGANDYHTEPVAVERTGYFAVVSWRRRSFPPHPGDLQHRKELKDRCRTTGVYLIHSPSRSVGHRYSKVGLPAFDHSSARQSPA